MPNGVMCNVVGQSGALLCTLHRRRNRGGQGGHGPPNNLSANAVCYCVF